MPYYAGILFSIYSRKEKHNNHKNRRKTTWLICQKKATKNW